MAKIETLAKPIEGFESFGEYAPQHLYIVHTKDNGEQIAYRGGPEKGNFLRDDLKVAKLSYRSRHPDFAKEGESHIKRLVIQGNDGTINSYIEKIKLINIPY